MSSKVRYIDPKVASFMNKTSYFKKRHLQDVLFSNNPYKSYPQILPLLQQQTFQLNRSDPRLSIPYTSKTLEDHVLRTDKRALLRKYEKLIKTNSIMIIIKDASNTLTDVNYVARIDTPIKELDLNIQSINTYKPALSLAFKKDKTLKRLISSTFQDPKTYIKMITVPIRSILKSNEVLEILLKQDTFDVLSIFINLDNSPIMKQEISEISKSASGTTAKKQINYESLMKLAKESHAENISFTKTLLTKIGEIGFLEVEVGNSFVSFNKKMS